MSDRFRSPQDQEDSQRHGPQKQKGRNIVAEKQPSELPKAKKHNSLDSDEDDEEPQNELGTSSNSQPIAPVFLICMDQLPVQFLVTKTVSIATRKVHKVRTLEEQCSIQISTF